MPSTDRKLELTAKASMAQPVSQPAVCSNVLRAAGYVTSAAAVKVMGLGGQFLDKLFDCKSYRHLWSVY